MTNSFFQNWSVIEGVFFLVVERDLLCVKEWSELGCYTRTCFTIDVVLVVNVVVVVVVVVLFVVEVVEVVVV